MRLTRLVAFGSALLCSGTSRACTVCDSSTGRQLRAGLFDGHFGHTLLLVVAPIPVFVAAVFLLQFALPHFSVEKDQSASPVPSGPELSATELLV